MKKSNRIESLQQCEAIQSAVDCIGCAHEGKIVTDANGRVLETNLATDRILERPSLSLIGTHLRDVCPVSHSYDEMRRHAESDGRILNRPLILETGIGKRKLVNM